MSSTSSNSSIFHKSLEKTYPTAVKGEGVYLITSDGRKIFDGSSGAAVSSLGHGNEEVIEAVCNQARNLAFAHSAFFTSDPAEELAQLLLKNSKDAFAKVLYLSSGSEAVESALKLARQYHVYHGHPGRVNFVGRFNSYHGNTLGALAAGNNPARRDAFAPILAPVFHHVSRCFHQADGQGLSEIAYEDKLIAEYEDTFERLGPQTIAAVIVEPVVGATIGSVPATKTYLPRLSELCKRAGVLLIYDEVMCGMGRVGTYHAWESLGGIAPDLQTIGKGLGAGYQPLAAVLVSKGVYETFQQHSTGPQAFLSGHTFQGHSMGCAGALAVQKILEREALVDNCYRLGQVLYDTLSAELPIHFKDNDGHMRGLGLFRTVDFGNMGKVFGGRLAKEVAEKSFQLGAAVYLCSPVVDAILFCPPFIMTKEETIQLARIFIKALGAVLESRK